MYDVIIIGAGPAGASAALFTAKAEKKTLLIDNGKSMTKRAWMENHYGILEISGPDLVEIGKKQAAKFGTEIVEDQVLNITQENNIINVETENQNYQSKHVIIATGISTELAEKIGLELVDGTEPRIKKVINVDKDGKTNIDGIWAAGTIAGVSVHTIVTSGHGAQVAINIISALNGTRYVDHDILKA